MAYTQRYKVQKTTNIDREIQRMVEYIEQDGLEKVEEINIKAEEEFMVEKNRHRDSEIVKIASQYEVLEKKLDRESRAEFSRIAHRSRLDFLKAQDVILEGVRKSARERLRNIDCEGNIDAYRKILTALILQGILKLLDKEITVTVREKDRVIVDECLKTAIVAYREATKQEVNAEIADKYLPEECFGGVVISRKDGSVLVDNTLESRLLVIADRSDSPLLPKYRVMLFGVNPARKHFD